MLWTEEQMKEMVAVPQAMVDVLNQIYKLGSGNPNIGLKIEMIKAIRTMSALILDDDTWTLQETKDFVESNWRL